MPADTGLGFPLAPIPDRAPLPPGLKPAENGTVRALLEAGQASTGRYQECRGRVLSWEGWYADEKKARDEARAKRGGSR